MPVSIFKQVRFMKQRPIIKKVQMPMAIPPKCRKNTSVSRWKWSRWKNYYVQRMSEI